MQDLVAGHIDLTFNPLGIEHVRAGRLKAYAVTAKNRVAHAPEIPTIDEAGLPGFYASVWLALWAPKDTPPRVVERLNDAISAALADTTVQARLTDLAYDIFPPEQQRPEALAAFQKAEIEKWWPIIREAGKIE